VVKHARTEKAQLSLKAENNHIVVLVVDNGIGFNEPDAFFKHIKNGGYGLYNVQQRVERMGGSFFIDSSPGKGTSVTLMVPFADS
jgi:signal transduction histidine kinase